MNIISLELFWKLTEKLNETLDILFIMLYFFSSINLRINKNISSILLNDLKNVLILCNDVRLYFLEYFIPSNFFML